MNVGFYQYNDSGEIVQTGSCPEEWIYLQNRPGLTTVVGVATTDSHYVDENGVLKEISPRPSLQHRINRVLGVWEDHRSVTDATAPALDRIDQLAGKARLRYITSVPGQAETYQKKEEQARTWAASNFSGEPPSFIAAEASALGRDPVAVAQEIIGLANYWMNFKGPEIEACRRKWKVAVESATSVIQVDNLIIQAIAELDSL